MKIKRPFVNLAGRISIIFVATAMILIWFQKGLVMGGGESGPFYNPTRMFEIFSRTWGDDILGGIVPISVTAPFFFLLSFFEHLGVPMFVLQAFLFWLILVVGSLSIYHLTPLVDKSNSLAPTLAAFFYMLSPFAMIVVWQRFQYAYMFFYALAPLALLFYVKGLESRKIIYALYVNVASLIFGYSFGSTPLIGTFWLILLSYFIFYIFSNLRNIIKVVYAFKFSAVIIVLWLLLNSWWIIPFISTGGYVFQQIPASYNLIDLLGISRFLNPLYVIRLTYEGFFKNMEPVWSPIYLSATFNFISFFIPIIVFSSLLLVPRNKFTIYFAFLAVLGIFLAKGAAPPVGELFTWIFSNFPPFQVFRNPFEKLGFVLPLAYAPLFGIGLAYTYEWMIKHLRIMLVFNYTAYSLEKIFSKILVIFLCFLVIGIYMWPMWTGMVFMSPIIPLNNADVKYYVQVPPYYDEARAWLSAHEGDFRIIGLPLTRGVGITYNWTYGYNGYDFSGLLLGRPTISLHQGVVYNDDIIRRLEGVLFHTTEFWKVMALLNAKYVVVRSDVSVVDPLHPITPPEDILSALNYTVVPSIIDGEVNISSTSVRQLATDVLQNWVIMWVNSSLPYSLVIDNKDSKQSASSITLNAHPSKGSDGKFYVALAYNFVDQDKDWSNVKYLMFWLKSNITGALWISMADSHGNDASWDGRVQQVYSIRSQDANQWKLIVIPLSTPSWRGGAGGALNLSSIKSIGISIISESDNKPTIVKIGGIFTDKGKLIKVRHIEYSRSIGKLTFYKLDDKYFVPRIYAVNSLISASDVDDFLFKIIPNETYDPRNTVVFLKNQLSNNELSFLSGSNLTVSDKPDITFSKLDPTKWIVYVKNATAPFILVFSETYHTGWKAYLGDVDSFNVFFSEPILEQYHFIANGYANAWYINKTGSFTVTLYFKPQSYLYLGTLVSISTLMAICAGILYVYWKNFKQLLTRNKRH